MGKNPCWRTLLQDPSRKGAADLATQLRAAGDPLHLMAAEALVQWRATAERLQERVYQLEAIARLNGETIRNQQRAAREAERAQYRTWAVKRTT